MLHFIYLFNKYTYWIFFPPRTEPVDKSQYKSQTWKIGGGAMLREGLTHRQTDRRQKTDSCFAKPLRKQGFCHFLHKRVFKMAVIRKPECYLGVKADNLIFEAIFRSHRPDTLRRIRRHVSNRSRTLGHLAQSLLSRDVYLSACAQLVISPVRSCVLRGSSQNLL